MQLWVGRAMKIHSMVAAAVLANLNQDPKQFDARVKQGYAQRLPAENCNTDNKEDSAGPFCAGINFGAVLAESETVQRMAVR